MYAQTRSLALGALFCALGGCLLDGRSTTAIPIRIGIGRATGQLPSLEGSALVAAGPASGGRSVDGKEPNDPEGQRRELERLNHLFFSRGSMCSESRGSGRGIFRPAGAWLCGDVLQGLAPLALCLCPSGAEILSSRRCLEGRSPIAPRATLGQPVRPTTKPWKGDRCVHPSRKIKLRSPAPGLWGLDCARHPGLHPGLLTIGLPGLGMGEPACAGSFISRQTAI